MAEDQKRPEATHRQRAALAGGGAVMGWPVDANGEPMAIVTGTASDLVPTVPFGNVLVGPVSIMRPVPNGTPEEIAEAAMQVQKWTEFIVSTERRIVQWAIDPSSRVVNPATGEELAAAAAEALAQAQATPTPPAPVPAPIPIPPPPAVDPPPTPMASVEDPTPTA